MLKRLIYTSSLLVLILSADLHSQDTRKTSVPTSVEAPQPSTPFPSPSSPRSKVFVRLVRHGCFGTCSQYSITVSANGRVTYEGMEFVRVRGKIRGRISHRAVDALTQRVNESQFFSLQIHESTQCTTDGPTATVAVIEPGRQRQIDDECIQESIEELEQAIDQSVDIQQWVFIRANELQRQIDEGWDVGKHGKEYARVAVRWDDPEVLRVLVTNGVPVDSQNRDGETLLLQAVLDNRYKSAKVLLELGANPRTRDNDGIAPFQNGANRDIEMCKLLLRYGDGIDDQDGLGETLLMHATDTGHLEIVTLLVSSGAALNIRNRNGETAIGIAKRMRQQFQQYHDDPERVNQYNAIIGYLNLHGGTE